METRKSSKEWNDYYNFDILDPDGWDRENLWFSFNEEEITLDEFFRRLSVSTCRLTKKHIEIIKDHAGQN